MRRLVHILLLAAALCAVADATYVNYLPAQSVLQPVVAYPAQSYGYNLPPVQRYILLNGQPYAVLGEQIQYLPAASAAPYTASNQLGAGAVTVNAAAPQEAVPPVSPEAASNGQAAPDASATAYAGAATSSAASAAEAAPVESSEPASRGQDPAIAAVVPEAAPAPAADPAPSAVPAAETSAVLPSDSVTPGRGLDSAVAAAEPAPAAAAPPAVPVAETEPVLQPAAPAADGRGLDSAPAVVPEASPAPATAPAPAAAEPAATRGSFPEASPSADAPTTQSTSVYLSSSSGPSVPLAQRFLVLSVNNPKVTVRRQDTVYSWHHPEQAINAPLKMVFYKDPLAAAPASDPLQIGSKTISIQSNGLTATINPQPNEVLGNSVDPAKISVYSQPQPSAFQPSTTPVFSAPQPAAPQTSPITLYSSPQTTTNTVYSAAQPSPSQPSVSVYSAAQPSPSSQPSASLYSAPQPSVSVYSAPQPSPSQPSVTVYSSAQPSASVYSAPQPSVSVYSAAQPSTSVYSAPQPSAQQSAEDLIRYTLSQSPLLRVHVDPVTHSSYFLDSQGRRIDLTTSAPAAPPAPVYQTTTDYAHTGPYAAAPSSAAPASSDYTQTSPQYYGSAKGLPAPSLSGASENYKAYDMAGLAPLERMYAPSTYKGPVPQSPTYDKPLTLSISTGKEAENSVAGPPSPLSPGDFGPSRGDSVVENPSRPKPLWSDARAR